MKSTPDRKRSPKPDDMRAEYEFDYSKARKNRFSRSMQRNTVAVILDPDVAEVFQTSEAVNAMLRSVLSGLPHNVKHGPTTD